jgi:hypothetical protein
VLTLAGLTEKDELVKYFIENEEKFWYKIAQIIDELELIGSHCIESSYKSYTFEKLYHYLLWAM